MHNLIQFIINTIYGLFFIISMRTPILSLIQPWILRKRVNWLHVRYEYSPIQTNPYVKGTIYTTNDHRLGFYLCCTFFVSFGFNRRRNAPFFRDSWFIIVFFHLSCLSLLFVWNCLYFPVKSENETRINGKEYAKVNTKWLYLRSNWIVVANDVRKKRKSSEWKKCWWRKS